MRGCGAPTSLRSRNGRRSSFQDMRYVLYHQSPTLSRLTSLGQKARPLRAGDEWPRPLTNHQPIVYTARGLRSSPWGIMALGLTHRSPRLQPWGDVTPAAAIRGAAG